LALRAGAGGGKESLLMAKLPASAAGGAVHGFASRLGARSLASAAGLPPRILDFGFQTRGRFFQADFQVVAQINSTRVTAASAPASAKSIAKTEQVTKDVFKIGKDGGIEVRRPAPTASHRRVSKAVVGGAFLGVGQH